MSKRKRAVNKGETDDDSDIFFGRAAAYNPKKDGTLEAYLETHDGNIACPLFKGFDHFEMLRSEGWLGPRFSIIRLMWNVGRGDEHFGITEDWKLEGIPLEHHGGREGIHDPRIVLAEGPCFEAQQLLYPYLRKRHAEFLEEMRVLMAQRNQTIS